MFVNYCGKSTLKSMCPTFCLPECNLTTIQQLSTTTTTLLNFDTTTSVDKVRTFKFNFVERLIDTEQPIKSTTMKMKASLNKYSLFIPKNETKEPELEEITTTNPSKDYPFLIINI
jgi:hypothetical protein